MKRRSRNNHVCANQEMCECSVKDFNLLHEGRVHHVLNGKLYQAGLLWSQCEIIKLWKWKMTTQLLYNWFLVINKWSRTVSQLFLSMQLIQMFSHRRHLGATGAIEGFKLKRISHVRDAFPQTSHFLNYDTRINTVGYTKVFPSACPV